MPKRNLIWALAVVAASLVTLLVTRQPPGFRDRIVIEFDPVTDAYRQIKDHSLYPVDEDELRRQAIVGMVASLDDHSRYLPPEMAAAFADRMKGLTWGLGLRVELADGRVRAIGPLVDSPAQHAGPAPGDVLLQVDGNDLAGLSARQVEQLLDEPREPVVRLLVRRRNGQTETLRCTRERFSLESVLGLYRGRTGQWDHMVDRDLGVAYVRIREILPSTPEHLRGVVRRLDRLRALILDLRGNPGGDLPAAVELCDMLLAGGRIVTIVDRAGHVEHREAQPHGTIPSEVRVVVLIDGATASAAEMVAAALAFHRRGLLVGQRTRGKGCVQSVISLGGNLGQISLTTGEFYLDPNRPILRPDPNRPAPRGGDANAWGVAPHLEASLPPAAQARLENLRIRAEVIRPAAPETRPATQADTLPEEEPAVLLIRLDGPLRLALALARSPHRIDHHLRQAAEPASRPAASVPAPAKPPP